MMRNGSTNYRHKLFGVLLNDGQVVGRIFKHSQAVPWFWTITAREYPPTTHSRGYSATGEQAMTDFKKQWVN